MTNQDKSSKGVPDFLTTPNPAINPNQLLPKPKTEDLLKGSMFFSWVNILQIAGARVSIKLNILIEFLKK